MNSTDQTLDYARRLDDDDAHGIVIGFDLAHAVGNVELQLHDWDVDFAVWCSYKYLNSGPGAVAGCFIHQRHASNTELPRMGGWWGQDKLTRFHMVDQFTPIATAEGWQLSNPPIHALAPIRAALELFTKSGRMLHLENGEQTFSPYGQRDNEVIYSVSRQLLNQLLVDRAIDAPEVNIHFGRKCTGVDFDASTLTLQHVDDGNQETRPFDLLIGADGADGADGAGSRVRRSLMEKLNEELESEFLDHDYKELEIPPTTEGTWKLEKEALHIWPRDDYMLIALPNLDGSFTVTLFLPKTGTPSFTSLKDESTVSAFFESVFPSATELMPDLLKDFFGNPTGRLGTVRCAPWHYENRALIVGDAAHAIVPFHGQGMNCAFEDCTVLDQLLDQNDDDWQRVNPRFTDQRKPDTDAIAEMAIEKLINSITIVPLTKTIPLKQTAKHDL